MSKKKRHSDAASAAGAQPPGPTKSDVYKAAKAMVRGGVSVIPVRADGSKQPAFELLPKEWSEEGQRFRRPWSTFKTRRPTLAELRA